MINHADFNFGKYIVELFYSMKAIAAATLICNGDDDDDDDDDGDDGGGDGGDGDDTITMIMITMMIMMTVI
jgi:hypothetical protein